MAMRLGSFPQSRLTHSVLLALRFQVVSKAGQIIIRQRNFITPGVNVNRAMTLFLLLWWRY